MVLSSGFSIPGEYFVEADVKHAQASINAAKQLAEFKAAVEKHRLGQKDFFVLLKRQNTPCSWCRVAELQGNVVVTEMGEQVIDIEIVDWAFSENGWMVGGFTVTAIYESLKREFKEEFRDRLPFAIISTRANSYGAELVDAIGHQEVDEVRRVVNLRPKLVTEELWTAPDRNYHAVMRPRKMFPLEYAARYGNAPICRILIEHGADVNAIGQSEYTALDSAAIEGNVPVIETLVAHGARIDFSIFAKPISAAVANNHLQAVKRLVELGANIHLSADSGTLLHRLPNNPEMAEYLVSKGIGLSCKNSDGETALDIARINGHTELIEKLEELEANAKPD